MRLINTQTGTLEEFMGTVIPRYAILSHTWEEEEVSFSDMSNPDHTEMKGFKKIEMTCKLAAQVGLDYAWVDTCCIDKSSSAELSEAINSMYQWYGRSETCFAYLSDLSPWSSLEASSLGFCKWFSRGWTLQELIAPKSLLFFDQEWNPRGDKPDLADAISKITGISQDVLLHKVPLSMVPVAQRMAWAAGRKTTRIEDRAYSLLGIFDVNMPLLYGEEQKAFRRLQEEIIKTISDLSIFAWKMPDSTRTRFRQGDDFACGILATEAEYFSDCLRLEGRPDQALGELSISNRRVKTRALLVRERVTNRQPNQAPRTFGRHIIMLECSIAGKSLGVRLRMCGAHQFVRENPWELFELTDSQLLFPNYTADRYILTEIPRTYTHPHLLRYLHMDSVLARIRTRFIHVQTSSEVQIRTIWPGSHYDVRSQLIYAPANLAQDGCFMYLDICLDIPPSPGQQLRKQQVQFQGALLLFGWANLRPGGLQFGLADYETNRVAIERFTEQAETTGRDHMDTQQVMKWLINNSVSRVPSVIRPLNDGSGLGVCMRFTESLVTDERVADGKFWRVEFSYEVGELVELCRCAPKPQLWTLMVTRDAHFRLLSTWSMGDN